MEIKFIYSLPAILLTKVKDAYNILLLYLCLYTPSPAGIDFWMPETFFMKAGMYNLALEPISTAYFINATHQSVCMCIPTVSARQQLSKDVSAATNIFFLEFPIVI